MSVGGSDAGTDPINPDLDEILRKLDVVEQSVTQLLNFLQKELSKCANHMLDAVMNGISSAVDDVKDKVPHVQKLRHANRSVKKQLRVCNELGQD